MSQVSEALFSDPFSSQNENVDSANNTSSVLVPDSQNDSESSSTVTKELNSVCHKESLSFDPEKDFHETPIPCSLSTQENSPKNAESDSEIEHFLEHKNSDETNGENIGLSNPSAFNINECLDPPDDIPCNDNDIEAIESDISGRPEHSTTEDNQGKHSSKTTEVISDDGSEVEVLSEKEDDVIEMAVQKEKKVSVVLERLSDSQLTTSTVQENIRQLRHKDPQLKSNLGVSKFYKMLCDNSNREVALEKLTELKQKLGVVQQHLETTINVFSSDSSNDSNLKLSRNEFLQNLDDTLLLLDVSLDKNEVLEKSPKRNSHGRKSNAKESKQNKLDSDSDENSAVTKESLRKALSKKKEAKRRASKSTKSPSGSPIKKRTSLGKGISETSPEKHSLRRSNRSIENGNDNQDVNLDTKRKALKTRISQQKTKILGKNLQQSPPKRTRNDSRSSVDAPMSKSPKNEDDSHKLAQCTIILQDLTCILKNVAFDSIRLSDLTRDQKKMLLTACGREKDEI